MRIDCNSAGVHREMIAGIAGNVNLGTRKVVCPNQQQWKNVNNNELIVVGAFL